MAASQYNVASLKSRQVVGVYIYGTAFSSSNANTEMTWPRSSESWSKSSFSGSVTCGDLYVAWWSSVSLSGVDASISYNNHTYALHTIAQFKEDGSATSYRSRSDTVTIAADYYANLFVPIYIRTDWTVTFNANGGSVETSTKAVTRGSAYGDLPTPTRIGYNFDGWYTAASGGTKVTSSTTYALAANQTLYAHWTGIWYELGYDNQFLLYEWQRSASYGLRSTPTGASLGNDQGWPKITSGEGTHVYTKYGASAAYFNIYVQPRQEYWFYCNMRGTSTNAEVLWVALDSNYHIIQDSGRDYRGMGSSGQLSENSYTAYSKKFTVPYNCYCIQIFFDVHDTGKWASFRNLRVAKATPYSEISCTTRLAYQYSDSATYGTLATPTRTGYTFLGWFTGENGTGTQITSSTAVQWYSLTVYSHWSGNEQLAILDPQGGELSSNYFLRIHTGSAYGTLPTPTRTGYTFLGWFTAPSGGSQVTSLTTVTATTTHALYAQWSGAHTVYFDAAGGTVSEASRSVLEGSALGTLPTPTRTGYTFAGWYTSQAGGSQVTASTVMGDDDIWAYALWTAGTITVTFNANGGTVSEASRTVAIGGQYNRLPVPTWNGHNFDGWFTASTGGSQITAATTVTSTVNQTLYAHWSSGAVDWWGISFS